MTGLQSTGEGGKKDSHVSGCALKGKKVSNNCETPTIPHQISSGDADGWCWHDGITVHQDVPGCGRICSSPVNVGSKSDGTWGPWADTTVECAGAKLDEIWELQGDGTRKLADWGAVSSKAN